jgi:hypothetical protein
MYPRCDDGSVLASDSANGAFRAVFENDGHTAYFYACALSDADDQILDAMQIQIPVSHAASPLARIVWSTDGFKAGLVIGEQLHAIVDFNRRKGFCRSNFPPTSSKWGHRETWSDDLLELLS